MEGKETVSRLAGKNNTQQTMCDKVTICVTVFKVKTSDVAFSKAGMSSKEATELTVQR